MELNATISAEHFRLLNKCLDEAIASAVTEFARKQVRRRCTEPPPGFRLRNLSAAALLAFEAIKSGQVGVAGSTGTRSIAISSKYSLSPNVGGRALSAQRQIDGKS